MRCFFLAFLLILRQASGPAVSSSAYSVQSPGVLTLEWFNTGPVSIAGSARFAPAPGQATPAAMAILSYRQNGILVGEATVPAARPTTAARTVVDMGGGLRTGIAVANPNAVEVRVEFYFTDPIGQASGAGAIAIPANGQISRFVDEAPFAAAPNFTGSLTLNSDQPVGITALRGRLNERGEFLITTLPVADLSETEDAPAVLPHFVDGGGWSTRAVLINPFDVPIAGEIRFMNSTGAVQSETARYMLPARSAHAVASSGAAPAVRSGWIWVIADAEGRTPVSAAIFSYRSGGVTTTEASVAAVRPANSTRLFVDALGAMNSGEADAYRTGVALANPAGVAASVRLDFYATGTPNAVTATVDVPAGAHISMFVDQIPGFENLPVPFRGLLRVRTAGAGGIAVTGVRGRYNERREFLITTTPAFSDESSVNADIFPQFSFGGGYMTTVVLLGSPGGPPLAGTLSGYSSSGLKLALPGSSVAPGVPANLGPWNNDFAISESPDGLQFARRGLFIERAGVPAMALARDGRVFAMFQWFPVDRPDKFDRIAVMISADDGRTWTAPRLIEIAGIPSTLNRLFDPALIVLPDGRFRLYFASERGMGASRNGNRAVYSAISDDGIHFIFERGERLGFANAETYDPAIALLGDTWHLYCPITGGRGYHATSADGLNFAPQPDVTAASSFQFLGSVIPASGGLRFYGSGGSSVLFSSDGFTWAVQQSVNPPSPDPGVTVTRTGRTLGIHIGFNRQDAASYPTR